MKVSPIGSVSGGSRCPSVRVGVISPASVQVNESTPDDHLTAGPDSGVILPAVWRIRRASSGPTICAGVVSSASFQIGKTIETSPDDHHITGPNRSVMITFRGSVSRADRHPTIRDWIVHPAGAQIA